MLNAYAYNLVSYDMRVVERLKFFLQQQQGRRRKKHVHAYNAENNDSKLFSLFTLYLFVHAFCFDFLGGGAAVFILNLMKTPSSFFVAFMWQ